jgi:hypothetical protein
VKQALLVPGIVGDKEQYSTLPHFLTSFYNKANTDIKELKVK